jgi:hypothetical protein
MRRERERERERERSHAHVGQWVPSHLIHQRGILDFEQVGSSFGATMGLLLMRAYPTMNIQPGFYAMCAATAMLGSVFRSYISLVVLVVEGTQVRPCCRIPLCEYRKDCVFLCGLVP